MENNELHNELIRLALSQQLSADQKAAFQQLLATDAAFRKEYSLQRRLAAAAKEAQRTDLRQLVGRLHDNLLSEQDDQKLLDGFVKRTLSDADKATFRQRIETSAEFRKKVALHRRMYAALQQPTRLEKKKQIEQLHASLADTKPVILPFYQQRQFWYAAASILLVCTIGLWFYSQQPADPQMAKTQTFEIPFDQLQTGLGLTGQDTVMHTSIVVSWQPDAQGIPYALLERDTLKLYGRIDTTALQLQESEKGYLLKIWGEKIRIVQFEKIEIKKNAL